MNVAVVRGVLSSDPVWRDLPSGSSVVALEVTTECDEGPRATVPVTVVDPSRRSELERLSKGDEIVAVGEIRRRYFRAGAATASRTELVASQVIPAARSARVGKELERVRSVIRRAEG